MKNHVVFLSLAILLSLLGGCAWHGSQKYVTPIAANEKIDSSRTFYVPIGPDGKTKTWPLITQQAPAAGSGFLASDLVNRNLLLLQGKTIMGMAPESEKEALESAKQKGLDYVVYSRVNLWVDPMFMACTNTRQNGVHVYYLDEADVDMSVYDVKSEKVIHLSKLHHAGCPVVLLGSIPVGTHTPAGRFNKVLQSWMKENFIPQR